MEQNTRVVVREQFIASRLPYTEVERRVREGFQAEKNTIEISADGFWVINGEKTEHKATGTDGKGIKSAAITNGNLVLTYTDGKTANLGEVVGGSGNDGHTPYIENGYWYINGENLGVKAEYSLADYPVQSVNGKTGEVELSAADVGARPNTWIPTAAEVGARPNTWTPTYSEVGADKSGAADSAVSGHNTSTDAHNDIRLKVETLQTVINEFFAEGADNDDKLDRLVEIVALINSNKDLIDEIATSKVNVADIINNLTTNVANKPLSAAQGVALKALIDSLSTSKLDASALTEAIKIALDQAKTTGEFDGADGVGIYDIVKTGTNGLVDTYTITLSDGTEKTFTVTNGQNGAPGTSVTISSTSVTYAVSSNGTTAPTSGWQSTVPTVNNGQYLWTKTVVNYSDGKSTTAYSVGYKGTNGTDYVLTDADKKEIAGLVDEIPDYVVEEAEATIAKVFNHGNLGRTIRFIAISDTHEDSAKLWNSQITVSNKHAGQAIKYIADRIGLDFIAHLGDASSAGSSVVYDSIDTLINDVKNIKKWMFSEVRGAKTVFVPGNHDQCSDKQLVYLGNSGAFPLFGGICSGNKDRRIGCGYFDIDDAKVRVIYLNSADVSDSRVDSVPQTYLGYSQEQKNWLCETLINTNAKENADKWGILILSHAPLDYGADPAKEILLPYVNGGSYNGYNFSGKNVVKIISNVHGHTHSFGYGYLNDTIRRFCIPNAGYLGNNHYYSKTDSSKNKTYIELGWANPQAETYNKTANTGKDTTFSLVTIDLDNGKCYVDNYGAGIDRVFSTDYKPAEVIVPTAISNIRYSGETTVGKAIDKSKFTFTVTYSNGTTNTVTGATMVSPDTLTVNGNNSVTITYIEEGATVSGTITIKAQEEPAEPEEPTSNLFEYDATNPNIVLKARFNSSKQVVTDQAEGQLVTDYIEAKVGDVFVVTSDTAHTKNNYTGVMMLYEDIDTPIASLARANTYNDTVVTSEDGMTVTFNVVPSYASNGWDGTKTTCVRFCVAYTDVNSIVITKNGGTSPDTPDYPDTPTTPTNEIPNAINSDKSEYKGTNGEDGYQLGKRLNSSGAEKDLSYCVVTGFIPYTGGAIELILPSVSVNSSYVYCHLYNSIFTCINKTADGTAIDGSYHQILYWVNQYGATQTLYKDSSTRKVVIPASSINPETAYIRVSTDIADGVTLSDETFRVSFLPE